MTDNNPFEKRIDGFGHFLLDPFDDVLAEWYTPVVSRGGLCLDRPRKVIKHN